MTTLLRRTAATLGIFAAAAIASSTASAQTYTAHVISGTTAVGSDSAPEHVGIKPTASGTVNTIKFLTNGSEGYDFKSGGAATCSNVTAGTTCTVDVIFHPTSPGMRSGAVVLLDSANHTLGVRLVTANATGSLAVIRPGLMENIAGNGQFPYTAGVDGDGIDATSSSLFLPSGVVTDAAGNVYISDADNYRIRRVDAKTKTITTYGGIGTSGNTGDGQPATNAAVNNPTGLAIDGAGNLYIADSGNNAIRRIDAFTGIMTTVAGKLSSSGYDGDGGQATDATLTNPNGVSLDAQGNLYIADTGNNAVRRVDAGTGVITTVADGQAAGATGTAIHASLNNPWSLAFGPAGVLYIADRGNNAIRTIDTQGNLSTVAGVVGARGDGGDGGPATSAGLNGPTAIAVDPAGDVYIADSGNNTIRRVDGSTQIITILSGSVSSTVYTGDGDNADKATFYGPYALYLDGSANLLIADLLHNHVRRISALNAVLSYPVMRVSKLSSPQIEGLENDGNADLTPTGLDASSNQAQLDPSTTNCSSTIPVSPSKSCNLGIVFAPTEVSPANDVTHGQMVYDSSASNSPTTASLSGQVLSVNPTTTTLASSLNPAGVGQSVTFTATVKSDASSLTGTVAFYDGSNLLGNVTLASGSAIYTTSSLAFGSHTITAKYSGDDQDAAGTSNTVTENIEYISRLALTSTPNPSTIQASVTFTALLKANNAPLAGATVNFYDSANQIGTGTTDSTGFAVFTTAALTVGTHSIVAKFAGDTSDLAATSNTLSQEVDPATTTTMVSASPSTAYVGNNVTLTAKVMSNGGPTPTKTVTFQYVNFPPGSTTGSTTITLGTATLDGTGQATLQTSSLLPGNNTVTAVYGGDDSNKTSTSSGIPVATNQLPTVTTVSSATNPSNAGFSLQITANITVGSGQTADGAINGTATFYDGSATLGTSPVVNGVATLSTTALNSVASPHNLTATYTPASPTGNYTGSTSTGFSQTVLQSATSTALTLSASSIIAGKSLTMTAIVGSATAGGVTPTGTVTFSDGSGFTSSPIRLDGTGTATFSTTSLSVGSHTITATYGGDGNYGVSSQSKTVTVNIGMTNLTLSGNPTTIQATSNVTFNASLTTSGVLPASPSITLTDNGAPFKTLTVTGGSASFSTTTLSVGVHNIVAIYTASENGDANNTNATSNTVTITVNSATTTTTLTTSKNPSVVGDAVTIQATVNSTAANVAGNVTFYDGANSIGSSPVSSGVASITLSTLNVAQHPLKAVYTPTDSIHAASTSAIVVQQVVQPTVASLKSDNNPAIAGTPVNLVSQVVASSASTSPSALPTGTVTYKEGSTIVGTATLSGGIATLQISNLSVGTHNIVASYGGDTLYQASSSANLVEIIRNATTGGTLTVSANPASYGTAETLTAHLTGNGGTISGTVTFLDGATSIGTAPVASNGAAVFTTSTLAPGMHSLIASYAGDGGNSPSVTSTVNLQVLENTQTSIAVDTNPAPTLSTVVLTATVRNQALPVATGTITFSDGSTILGTATLNSAGVATLQVGPFSAATHSITAAYGGDVGNRPSVSSPLSLVVQLRPTQTALSATAPSPDGFLSLIAAIHWDGPAVPTGVVTFSTPTGVIGTSNVNSVGVATLNIVSSAINGKVTASYGGDTAYSGSVSPATTIQLAAATNFTIGLNPTSMSVQSKQYVVAELTVQSVNGFTDTMNVGCLGLPKAATCTFNQNSVALTSNGSFVVKVTVDTGSPLTAGGNTAELRPMQNPARGSAATTATLAGLPAGALLGMMLLGRRKRKVTASLLILLLAVCLMPMFGCGTIDQASTPPGTYTFAVSAVGQHTGVTLSQNITLTVTQ